MNSSESTKQNVLRKNTKEKPGILGLLLDKKNHAVAIISYTIY